MNCKKCDNQLEVGINLCPNCGKEYLICLSCGNHNELNTDFCTTCGNSLNGAEVPVNNNESLIDIKKLITEKKPLTYIIITACVISLFLIITVIWKMLPDKNRKLDNIIYINNGAIYNKNLNKGSSKKLIDIEIPQDKWIYEETYLKTKVSSDGKRIFYPGSLNSSYDLHYSSLGFLDESGIIDTDVNSYSINDKGSIVYYTKDSDRALYRCDINKRTKIKIEDSVKDYYINPEGTKAIFTHADCIYVCSGNTKTLLAVDAKIIHISNDLSRLYYIKTDRLYLVEDGKEAKLVTEEIIYNNNIFVYDTGEIYFIDNKYNLYYYYKNKTVIVSDSCVSIISISSSKPLLLIEQLDSNDVFIVNKDKVKNLNCDINSKYLFNNSGTSIYYLDYSGGLFTYDIEKDESKIYDENVCNFAFLNDSDKCIYTKNEKNWFVDLYINKKKIDSDVRLVPLAVSSARSDLFCDSKGNVLYNKTKIKDHESLNELWLYNGKEAIRVANKYDRYYYLSSNSIVYMVHSKDYTYDLYLFNGKSSTLLKRNIQAYMPITKETYSVTYLDYMYNLNTLFGYDIEAITLVQPFYK